jgi:hypothetical protein
VVAGRVAPARLHPELIAHDTDGRAFVLPGPGGIHPAVHMGDLVDAWIGDHLLPGASAEDAFAPPAEPGPFHLLACIGNRAFDATGRPLGVVAGKRGGLAPGFWPPNLLAIEASRDRLMTLSPGDGIRLEAEGRGLALDDFPDLALSNVSPRLLDALPLETDGTRLVVEVSLVVPSRSAGSGLGQDAWVGDLEIADQPWLAGTERPLRFGDLVAFDAVDARTMRFHRPGHVAIGLVAHGPGHAPGHGIGVTILLSGPAASLSTRVVAGAGLGGLLNIWGAET